MKARVAALVAVPMSLAAALAIAGPASAQCAGECSTEVLAAPKSVEKYVKSAWKSIAKCAKRGEPACPAACPLPDATAAPFSLGSACGALLACELQAVAEDALAPVWDAANGCALAAAGECGNARAKAAGKLVSSHLKLRRTSKVDKLAAERARCVATANKKQACDGETLCAGADAWIEALVPVRLSKGGYQTLAFDAAASGEASAVITASAESAGWASYERESVVMELDLDGSVLGTIVVYGGAVPTQYRVLLGAVAAGPHVLGLRHSRSMSPASDSAVVVHEAPQVTVLEPGAPGYDALRFAPVLLGLDRDLNVFLSHPGNTLSDVPVLEYVRAIPGAGMTTYRYVMIWSNEDGGTGVYPEVLMAQYGRTTDIEGIVEVDVSDGGVLQQVRFRPDESGTLSVFGGSFFSGTHPIVRTSTANGLVQDDGDSTLRFLTAPFEFDDSGVTRESAMDLDPTSYRIMGEELYREGKNEINANPANKRLSNVRNYLFVDYEIDVDVSGRVLRAYAVVDGSAYGSDHYQFSSGPLVRLVGGGTARTAIELPAGTTLADIDQMGMQSAAGPMSGTLYRFEAFMLDADYVPGPRATFTGALFAGGPSPTWTAIP